MLAATLIACCTVLSAGDTTTEVIRANYPDELLTLPEDGEDLRFSTHQVLDLDRDGKSNDAVVLYSNAGAGLLCAILSVDAAPKRVCADHFFTGANASLELLDFDGDGRVEFVIRFAATGNGARYAWIYGWRDEWVPVSRPDEPFRDPIFFDFDADGDLDALDSMRFGSDTQFVYLLADGAFQQGTIDILNWASVLRGEGPPTRVIRSISVPENREGAYPIRLVTNDSVTSAKVTVDGRLLFAPHHFRAGTRVLTSEPTPLTQASEVEVELAGKPGAEIVLLVMSR